MFKAVEKIEKVSENIIAQIRDAILSGQLKPGQRVASEKELVTQFGVSKATMREAVRVLESMGLVEIKKGVGGGIFIAEADMQTTINSIINFLYFKSPSIRDITMVRYILEPCVAQMAASVIQQRDIEALRKTLEEDLSDLQIGFHRYLARMTGNPIMILIMDFIDNILRDIKLRLDLGPKFYEKVALHHERILECLVKHDGDGARQEIIDDIVGVGKYMADLAGDAAFDPTVFEDGDALQQPAHGGNGSAQFSGFAPLAAELEKIVGTEGAMKLMERGALFQRVGSKEALIVFEGKSK